MFLFVRCFLTAATTPVVEEFSTLFISISLPPNSSFLRQYGVDDEEFEIVDEGMIVLLDEFELFMSISVSFCGGTATSGVGFGLAK